MHGAGAGFTSCARRRDVPRSPGRKQRKSTAWVSVADVGLSPALRRDQSMPEIVLMPDPRIAAIPVADCGEKLRDVRLQEPVAVDPRKEERSGASAHLREGGLAQLFAATHYSVRYTRTVTGGCS